MGVIQCQTQCYTHLLINDLLIKESKRWQSEAKIRLWQNIFSFYINIHFSLGD